MEILYANGMKENKSGLFAYELSTLKRGLFEGTRLVLSLCILKEFVYEISLFLNQHKHFHQTDLLATQYVHLKRGVWLKDKERLGEFKLNIEKIHAGEFYKWVKEHLGDI